VKVHAIGSLIASLDDLKAIHVRATRHAQLQLVYRAAVPKELARRSRVIDERSGTLVIAADTSGVAAKLRQLVPRIVADIVKCCPEVTAIRVEVQVADGQPPTTPRAVTACERCGSRWPADSRPSSERRWSDRRYASCSSRSRRPSPPRSPLRISGLRAGTGHASGTAELRRVLDEERRHVPDPGGRVVDEHGQDRPPLARHRAGRKARRAEAPIVRPLGDQSPNQSWNRSVIVRKSRS